MITGLSAGILGGMGMGGGVILIPLIPVFIVGVVRKSVISGRMIPARVKESIYPAS